MASSQNSRVVIDTNIFVSGILYGGNAERVLRLFGSGSIEIVISPEIWAEILLTLKKFELPETDLDELSDLIQTKARKVNPKEHIRVSRDPKDNMLLETAVAGRADYLVTGDKDLLILDPFRTTRILNPKEFLDIIDDFLMARKI